MNAKPGQFVDKEVGTHLRFRSPPSKSLLSTFALAALLAVIATPSAIANTVYVANNGGDNVRTIDTATNQLVGAPIPVGMGPSAVAITPDGRRAYVANSLSGDVSVIDTATGSSAIGGRIAVPGLPFGVAISPDGRRAYVANLGDASVTVIDTSTNAVVGAPIAVGEGPEGIAVSPDGSRVYVVNRTSGNISVIDTATNRVLGPPITIGKEPIGIALTPDGSRAYVPLSDSGSVMAIDLASGSPLGDPIPVGPRPGAVAITPDGRRAYVANVGGASVSVVDIAANSVVGAPIPVGQTPVGITIAPDGKRAYVANEGSSDVSVIDLSTNQPVGEPIDVGERVYALAVTPNQPPLATFTAGTRARPGIPVRFDASASSDPDGQIATYSWSFGDGGAEALGTPGTAHVFAAPGTYRVSLTLTDAEGCGASRIFTGQTAFCSGPGSATLPVRVAYPGVRVYCPRRARRAGCRFKVTAVARRPAASRKPKSESAPGMAKAKAGRKAIVSLVPRAAFRNRLATARRVLVREVAMIGRSRSVHYRRLAIVR